MNDANFESRFRGQGAYAELIGNRFDLTRRRLGLARDDLAALDVSHFTPPGSNTQQLTLL